MLLDLIKSHSLLRCFQREQARAEDGSPCIIATREDFTGAVRLYDQLNGTAGGQETKLTKVEAAVLNVICKAAWQEFTVQQLQQVTGRSSSSIRKILHGYISRGYTYSGLLEKCPAISYTDRTVVSESDEGLSVRRRTMAYQFNPDLYRQWARGGSCWLDEDDDRDRGNQQGDDGHEDKDREDGVEERKRAERSQKNSTQTGESGSEHPGGKMEQSDSVYFDERKISDSEQQECETIFPDYSSCDSVDSAPQVKKSGDGKVCGISPSQRGDISGGAFRTSSTTISYSPEMPGLPNSRPNPLDFKKLDIIMRGTCDVCRAKKYLFYIEKLTERRKKLPPTDKPYYLCKECYQEAVQRERASAPSLPRLIDVNTLEQVTVDIGRCSLCGLEKAEWIDRGSGVAVCEGCWGRENLSKANIGN